MLLRNLQTINNNTTDILVQDGFISEIGSNLNAANTPVINFDHALVFPGLINSHDHLDFNLFPMLGNKLYANYVEWSHDIHRQNKEVINDVLKIPKALRAKWGVYKNLVCGVTTVVNHGEKLDVTDELITVFQQCQSLHSVRLEKNWKLKLNRPRAKKWPVAIHIGEGTDVGAGEEINELVKWNLHKRGLIGIHGIAMNKWQATNFKAIVWCPASNYFLIGSTANVNELKNTTNIVFGTDSALTASWDIWEHVRLARNEGKVSDEALFNMLTATPAHVWQMANTGKLERGAAADIVIARKKDEQGGYSALFAIKPEDILMVMHNGTIRLFDAELLPQLTGNERFENNFSTISINGRNKYVYGNLADLMKQIEGYYPEVVFPFEYKLI